MSLRAKSPTHDGQVQAPVKMGTTAPARSRRGRMSLGELWAFVAVALPVVAALESKVSAIDLAYQIRAGAIMLHTHRLIRTDSFTYTAAGRPWVDQQWGGQVLLAWIFRLGGWSLLALVRAGLVGVVFLLVYVCCRELGASKRLAAGLTIASFFVGIGALSLRPQLFGMVLFAVTVWILARRRRSPSLMWAIPPIVILWANLHGSFVLAPLLVGLAAVEDRVDRRPGLRRTLLVGAVSLAATTVNPFGLRIWAYVASLSTNPNVTMRIAEWQPPELRGYPGASFFISVAAVAAVLAIRRRSTPWPCLLTLGVFFVIGLLAVRGIFWWAVIVPPTLVRTFDDRPMRSGEREWTNLLNTAFALGLVAIGMIFLPFWRPVATIGGEGGSIVGDAPAGLTRELRSLPLQPGERIFSPQIYGSWFELELPDHPVFVDSRIEIFPTPVWDEYTAITSAREGWQEILARRDVRVVVADGDQMAKLLPVIQDDPSWRLVYTDLDGSIYLRV